MARFSAALRPLRLLTISLCALLLAACGGGGGGGGTTPPPPAPVPNSISGIVMLGPVAGADIEVIGTTGVLATGLSDTDGRFGPLTFDGSYSGPLRVRATGDASSTWSCDFIPGCPNNFGIVPFGDSVGFDGELEAVLSTTDDDPFVTVSLLSHLVSRRADSLGAFTASNVTSAYVELADSLGQALAGVLSNLSLAIPTEFATVELFDIGNVRPPASPDDDIALVLSFLNSGMMGLATPVQTTGQFLEQFSAAIAAEPTLPIGGRQFSDPSLESLITVMLVQVLAASDSGNPMSADYDALLNPFSLDDVTSALSGSLFSLPALLADSGDVFLSVTDSDLGNPIIVDVPVLTSDGGSPAPGDYGVTVFQLSPTPALWLSAAPLEVNSQPIVRLQINTLELAMLANGLYSAGISIFSTTGEYRRDFLDVDVQLSLVGTQVSAGPDVSAAERSTVQLSGSTTNPGELASVTWSQIAGPPVIITGGDTLVPTVELPSLDASQVATLQVNATFTDGVTRTDTVDIQIEAYANIADLTLADPVLQQCVNTAATDGDFVEVIEVLNLTCPGVNDASGLDAFPNLVSLNLSGNRLTTLQPVLALPSLEFVDLQGNPELSCDQVDQLAERLTEGTDLLTDDACRASLAFDLGAPGFDAALDDARGQIYVSVPSRREIVVLSLADLRIVDRLAMPGTPNGIDLSIDGTRLFAALTGSNAVAVVDLDQRLVSTIDLGVATDHPTTWDVVEGEPNRLFVSANPGSSGFAYVAQVRLDQSNLISRVANETIIRARPSLARSPDQQFVYVGAGFSPNSLYKLNLIDPDAPIALEDNHGSVGGTDNLALNSAGTRIALSSGQVLRTGSFVEEGRVTAGYSVGSSLSDTLFVAAASGAIEPFNFATLAAGDPIQTACAAAPTSRILAFDGDSSFFLLQSDSACLFTTVSRSAGPDPLASLRFPDLALEECITTAAQAEGFTQPEDFTVLDCRLNSRSILSLEEIDRLVNLETLNLSNSGVFDLGPLSGLVVLQSLTVQNAAISDASSLAAITSLVSVDLTGNPGVACTDLDQLVTAGKSVQSDACTESVRVELGGIGHDLELDGSSRAFVSIPSLNRISEIDLGTGTIAENFTLSGQPRGIDLGADAQTVFAALNGSGDIAVLDSATGTIEDIDVSVELDDDSTWDVAELSPNRIVASTNPGSGGFGYIVAIRRDLGDTAQRVASQRIIRAAPVFSVSADQSAVYVGEGFSPNSLYKLDAADPLLPIVLEDDHGEVSGTSSLALSPDGSRIYLRSGQVLATDSLFQVSQYPAGVSAITAAGDSLLVSEPETDSALVFDLQSTAQTGRRRWGCDLLQVTAIEEFGAGVLAMGEDLLCYSRVVPYP